MEEIIPGRSQTLGPDIQRSEQPSLNLKQNAEMANLWPRSPGRLHSEEPSVPPRRGRDGGAQLVCVHARTAVKASRWK